jgi:TonB family protein
MESATLSYVWNEMDDYSNDIDKYLKGQLTPAQMHALEKKALSDPFLAEALQGVGSLRSGEFQTDMADLQARIDKRSHSKSVVWMWAGRVAAGLLFLAVSTFMVIFLSNRQEDSTDSLALNKEQKGAADQQIAPSAAAPADSSTADRSSSPEVAEKESSQKQDAAAPAKPPAATRSKSDQSLADVPREAAPPISENAEQDGTINDEISGALKEEEKTASTTQPQSVPSEIEIEEANKSGVGKDDGTDLAKRKAIGEAGPRQPAASHNVNRKIVRGKVSFSEDGTGLPGVNVLVKGSNEGTVTDGQGNYQIPVEGQPTLQFSFIGFSTTEVQATDSQLDVQLNTDVSELSEVVVVGYSDDVGFLPSTPTVMELATPEGGRKVFKQYLEQNLQYPQEALNNQVEGKVTVQFTIGMTGQLSDFRVIRGLGFGCEEEFIRLIKQGPKWSPTKKNEAPIKDRVRVRMRFSLPKK